ncbi:hypothetical protein Y023_3692 [Burkholderia pseudomallei A79D]|nr:hypothetical protein X997_4361 [Burkholderia pseudomallei A79C]KGX99751.1 hypothetical protein Y023_3692 [Burkholderia pseudomallei A79D]
MDIVTRWLLMEMGIINLLQRAHSSRIRNNFSLGVAANKTAQSIGVSNELR